MGYDVWVDNCQYFTQLLAIAISTEEDREATRQLIEKNAVMKLPAAASWFLAPMYGCTFAIHYALRPENAGEENKARQKVGEFLDYMENFYLHPSVFAVRRKQNPF